VAPNGTDRISGRNAGAGFTLDYRGAVVLECQTAGRWEITSLYIDDSRVGEDLSAVTSDKVLVFSDDGSVDWNPDSTNNGVANTGTYATSANLLAANGGVSFIDGKSVIIVLDIDPDLLALSQFSSGRYELFSYGNSVNTSSSGKGVRVCMDPSGQIHLQLSGSAASVQGVRLIGSRRLSGRRHYVILWDRTGSSAGVVKCWIDGVPLDAPPITMVTDPGPIVLANNNTASRVVLGASPSSSSEVPLRISRNSYYEVQFWTRATLPADMDSVAWDLFSRRKTLPSGLKVGGTSTPESWPDLKCWYRMDDIWNDVYQNTIPDRADPAGGGPIVGPLTIVDNGRVARRVPDAFTTCFETYSGIRASGSESTGMVQTAAAARSGVRGYRATIPVAGSPTNSTPISTCKPGNVRSPLWYGRKQFSSGWYRIVSGFHSTGWMIQQQWKVYGHHNQFTTSNPATGASGNNPKIAWGFRNIDAGKGSLSTGVISEPGSPLQIVLTIREGRLNPWPTAVTFDSYTRYRTLGLPALEVPYDTWVKVSVEVYAHLTEGYVKIWQSIPGRYGETLIIDTGPSNTWSQLIDFADILPGAWKNQPELSDSASKWWCGSRYMLMQPAQMYTSGNTFNASYNIVGPIEDHIIDFADFEVWHELP
jgi:hypothetical protein